MPEKHVIYTRFFFSLGGFHYLWWLAITYAQFVLVKETFIEFKFQL